MKGAICYYSGSGNTEVICRFISDNIKHANFELINIIECKKLDFREYDIVGVASPTFHMTIPKVLNDFLTGIEPQDGKPAFLINTFGMMQGKALKTLNKIVANRGFIVIASHSLQMPENYPVFIAKGWTSADKPDAKQIHDFQNFICKLSSKVEAIEKGEMPAKVKVKIGFLNNIIPVKSRDKIIRETGKFKTDTSLCCKCGACARECPYKAISMESYPVFNQSKCWGCYKCFNQCAQRAIYTDSVKGDFQYNGPDKKLNEKLKIR